MRNVTLITRNRFFYILVLWIGVACQRSEIEPLPASAPERLQSYVKYLASDELEGRGTGTEGNYKAAAYIEKHFKAFGLKRVGKSYYQNFKVVTDVELADGNSVSVVQNGNSREWKVEADYIPVAFSGNASVKGDVAFAGYGITAKDLKYDDYATIDAKDKIVIVFRESPDFEDPHGKFTKYVSLNYKVRNAKEHGAAGVIFVNPPSDEDDELFSLKRMKGDAKVGIPTIHAKQKVVEPLLPAGKTLAGLEKVLKTPRAQGFDLPGVTISMTTALKFIKKPTSNVIGIVPGTDPKRADEYIIVGAHYDHLGWGQEGSRYNGKEPAIHHGADDNASGTATLLELSQRIAQNPLPRSVMFIGFGAEEMGSLGSNYYCKHPLVPLDKTVMMLNMDMVGRLKENKLQVTGTGTSSRWNPLVDSLAKIYQLDVSKSADGYGPSDHASFYARNLPVLNLFTGLHDDYHRPTDTWEKLNYPGMATIADFATGILTAVGNFAKRPDFVKVKSSGKSGNMTFRVTMGIIPDYADNPKGMRISGVREGGPADLAGMKDGDILVKFGDTEIKNIYDYTYALGKYKHGDKVKVVVLRGENAAQKVTLEVTLRGKKK